MSFCAGFSLVNSQLPAAVAWPLAAFASGCGLWRARMEWRRPGHRLLFPGGDQPATVDGVPVEEMQVEWRGPLAFACWRDSDGRRRRLAWWPDTLPADKRRELRLAATGVEAARRTRVMAP